MANINLRRTTSGINATFSPRPKQSGVRNLRTFRNQNTSKTFPTEQGNRTSIKWVAILSAFSLLAPVGYLIGYYFEEGYLHAFGIDQGLFLRSAQEYVMGSFKAVGVLVGVLASVLEFSAYMKWIFMCIGVGVYVLAIVGCLKFADWAMDRFKLLGKISQHVKKKSTATIVFTGAVLMLVPAILVYIPVFLVIPAMAAEGLGNKAAENYIQKFTGCAATTTKSTSAKSTPESCSSVYAGNKLIAQGEIISASEKYLALFNGKESVVISIRPDMLIVQPFQRK